MSTITNNLNGFKELGRELCPVCGHADRCKSSNEHGKNLVLCFRVADEYVNGYRLVKHTRGCSTYVRIGSDADFRGKTARTTLVAKSPPNHHLDELATKYAADLTDASAKQFAHELGVSVASLRRLGAGICGKNLCFPERSAAGKVIGINTRFPNQRPKYRVGGGQQRGLIIPTGLPDDLTYLLLPEGPSDTAACADMSLNAIGRPNNSSKAGLIAEYVRNISVPIILGENDVKLDGSWPGREGARRVAADIARILRRPVLWALVLPGYKDVREFLQSNSARDRQQLGHELLAHVLTTATPVGPFGGSDGLVSDGSTEIWPDPQPLPNELPPVAPFDFELLPEAVRDWVADIANRAQCAPDYPAVGVMVALSSLVGRKVAIRPIQRDDWIVVPNLWGGVIGRPGLLKTPMLQEAIRPLKRLELEAKKRFEKEQSQFEAQKLVLKAQRKGLEKAVEQAIKDNQDARAVAKSGLEEQETNVPIRRRYMVNDTTVEKLGEILSQNPNGVLYFRDELVGFLRSLEKDGRECDRAFYLEASEGKGRFTYDRIGRGTIEIDAAIVSVLGGIQPSVLQTFLKSSLDRVGNDGLFQRFQLLVWPDMSRDWVNIDEWPDTAAKSRAYAVFEALDELRYEAIDANPGDSDSEFPYLRFAEEAQPMFDDWRGRLETQLRSGELPSLLEEHLSKYRSLIPSIALIVHLADGGVGPVGAGPLSKAIQWGAYLGTHARRIYHLASNPDVAAATALAKKLLNRDLKDGFSLRDVYRNDWAGLADRDVAKSGADLLCELDWLRRSRVETGGAPKTQYWINPKIHGFAQEGPDITDKSPTNDLSSVLSGSPGKDSQETGGRNAVPDDPDRLEREARMDVEREAEQEGRGN